MDAASLLSAACIICALPASSRQLSAHFYEPRGQRICKRGTERPCYKIAYFEEDRRKLNFEEASQACRSDGGELLSIESAAEQKIVESFIQELRATDGDFWIGLQRNQGYQETSGDCPSQYFWLDGSQSAFRNWHWDEPSCGYEVCVVMYHQPSAPPGPSGLYMFQWNDDNCETKNNFICKYTKGNLPPSTPAKNKSSTDDQSTSRRPKYPPFTADDEGMKVVVPARIDNTVNIAYIVLPTIPLLLLLVVASSVFCFKLFTKRNKERTSEPYPREPGHWVSVERCNSPSPDVYNVIRRQHEADLAGTRPDIKNSSFLGGSPNTPPADYDNLASQDSESGFATLASTESGFVTGDLYDTCQARAYGRYSENGWMDSDLYSYSEAQQR
ncbi:layilin [Denticeps clupeoides]|uniref:layilin n=1 Tax=Denticeps clupeoides TaxID=299321 RepID=UPI0010A4F99B|nr:layilin [Denticeps clupeoides]